MIMVPFDCRRPAINKARLKFGMSDSPVAADNRMPLVWNEGRHAQYRIQFN
jgi:hypothetical protein